MPQSHPAAVNSSPLRGEAQNPGFPNSWPRVSRGRAPPTLLTQAAPFPLPWPKHPMYQSLWASKPQGAQPQCSTWPQVTQPLGSKSPPQVAG